MFHVLNRGVGGAALFEKELDYQAFERVMFDTLPDAPMRICGYCLMPNTGTCCCGPNATATWAASCNG